MRVIARGTLRDFVQNRVEKSRRVGLKRYLDAWFAEVSRAAWNNPADIKQQYRSASIISAERVVFNIKGNDYRLVVRIDYHFQIVLILWLGTHEEYDEIGVQRVRYEKQRYTRSTDSD